MANNSSSNQQKTFRCADAGFNQCKFEATGRDNNEVMEKVQQHGREAHGITNFDDETKRKIQDNIHDRQAA